MGIWAVLAHWAISSTVQTGLMVAIVGAVSAVAGSHFSPRWRAALWMLVLLRLIIPWTPPALLHVPVAIHALPLTSLANILPSLGMTPQPASAAPTAYAIPWGFVSGAVWFIGVAILAIRLGLREARFRAVIQIAPRREDSLPRAPFHASVSALRETDAVTGPAVWGIWEPEILVPPGLRESLSEDQWQLVMMHELAHVRRGDIWMRWASEVVAIICWFNPFVWVTRRQLRHAQELAADEVVLRYGDQDAQARYGHTLLDMATFYGSPVEVPSISGINLDRSSLARRIRQIHTDPAPRLARAVTLVATLLTVSLMTTAVVAASGGSGTRSASESPAVAWVNGMPISHRALVSAEGMVRKQGRLGTSQRSTLTSSQVEKKAIHMLVQDVVLAQVTKTRGLDPTVQQSQEAYRHMVATDPAFFKTLKKLGNTAKVPTALWVSNYRASIGMGRLEHQIVGKKPAEDRQQAWNGYVDKLVHEAHVVLVPGLPY